MGWVRCLFVPVALLWATFTPAHAAPLNNAPPTGPLVLDLAGGTLPSTYTEYSTSSVASSTSSDITFVFRHDPGWFAFDDASVVASGGGSNLLSNGGFESGTLGA